MYGLPTPHTNYWREIWKRLTESAYGQMRTPPPARNKSENPSYESLYKRLTAIEYILGDEYDLERLRELWFADKKGHCVVFDEHYPVSEYYRDEDGRYIRESSGVISGG